MPKAAIGFGIVLIAIGLFGYFGSKTETPSPTALIPAALGLGIAVCGALALSPAKRKHAMHAAAMIGLLGLIAGAVRWIPKFSLMLSDDLSISRPVRLTFLTSVVCLIFVALCVQSFIAARRARTQATGD